MKKKEGASPRPKHELIDTYKSKTHSTMIPNNIIQDILQNTRIEEVIGQFVELKKAGSDYEALSPWTNERTPSFKVSPSKQIFKDFSSGKGGDVIKFLREFKGFSFLEAMQYLSEHTGIPLEYEEQSEEAIKVHKEQEEARKTIAAAEELYTQSFHLEKETDKELKGFLKRRKMALSDAIEWRLGFANGQSKLKGKFKTDTEMKQAQDLFLINGKGDMFRNALIIPLHDQFGRTIGFTARRIDDNSSAPKYLNPSNTILYEKSKFLYGLHSALRMANQKGHMYVVEGYFDVIAMHRMGIRNCIGICGTSITDHQVQKLKKLVNRVTLFFDGDKAGRKNMALNLEKLVNAGLEVDIVDLNNGKDPDELARDTDDDEEYEQLLRASQKSGIAFYIEYYSELTEVDRVRKCTNLLSSISDGVLQETWTKEASKLLKYPKKKLEESISDIARKYDKIENVVDEDDKVNGFETVESGPSIGYYMQTKKGVIKVTNFLLKPLFHLVGDKGNSRLFIITGKETKEVVEIPSASLVSVDKLRGELVHYGNYLFTGGKVSLNLILTKLLSEQKKAHELGKLGWQPEGFFAWHDKVWNVTLLEFSEEGLISIEGKQYYSPGKLKLSIEVRNKELRKNDRYLKYRASKTDAKTWSILFEKVFGDNAKPAIGFILITIFKDIVQSIGTFLPFLYLYGPTHSGKNTLAEAISLLFFSELQYFNINGGTDYALSAKLERFSNCPILLNEFDDSSIRPEWYQMLKGFYDLEGRERGKMGGSNTTEIQELLSSIMLSGQNLSAKDDASIISRSIPVEFSKAERSDQLIQDLEQYKKMEREGLSQVLVEFLQLRQIIEEQYETKFHELKNQFRKTLKEKGVYLNDRVIGNYSMWAALYALAKDKIQLPWSVESYCDWAIAGIEETTDLVKENDILNEFWSVVETMFLNYKINEPVHFKIGEKSRVRVNMNGSSTNVELEEPTALLFVRLRTIHQLYLNHQRMNGQKALAYATLKSYIKTKGYFVGYVNSEKFSKENSEEKSTQEAYILRYDYLRISLQSGDREISTD
jgi:DNA primase